MIKSLKLSQATSVVLIPLDSSPNPFWIAFKDSTTSTSSLSLPLPDLVPMALVLPVMWLLPLCLCSSPTHPSRRKCHHFPEAFPKHAGAFGDLEWLFCLGFPFLTHGQVIQGHRQFAQSGEGFCEGWGQGSLGLSIYPSSCKTPQ